MSEAAMQWQHSKPEMHFTQTLSPLLPLLLLPMIGLVHMSSVLSLTVQPWTTRTSLFFLRPRVPPRGLKRSAKTPSDQATQQTGTPSPIHSKLPDEGNADGQKRRYLLRLNGELLRLHVNQILLLKWNCR